MTATVEPPYDIATIYGICQGHITDERMGLYTELCNVFTSVNYMGHLAEIDLIEVMVSSQTISMLDAVEGVHEALMVSAEACLQVIGVVPDADIPLGMMVRLCEVLLQFDVTETPELLHGILDASEDSVTCMADILGEITAYESHEWITQLEEVTPDCISSVRLLLEDAIAVNEATAPSIINDPELTKKKALLKATLPEASLALESSGGSLGELYEGSLNKLVSLDDKDALHQIMGLACISTESRTQKEAMLDNVIEDYFDDDRQRMAMGSVVRQLKSKLEHLLYR